MNVPTLTFQRELRLPVPVWLPLPPRGQRCAITNYSRTEILNRICYTDNAIGRLDLGGVEVYNYRVLLEGIYSDIVRIMDTAERHRKKRRLRTIAERKERQRARAMARQ